MKNLYIIGAGGLGRELYSWITLEEKLTKEYNIVGFIDDNLNKLDGFSHYPPIVGTLKGFKFNTETDYAILSIASSEVKERIIRDNEDKVNFISYISEKAIVTANSKIGKGVVVTPGVIISCDTILEDYVFLNLGTQVGHDVQIGKYTSLMANVVVGGETIIGNSCFIGSSSTIIPRIKIADKTTLGMSSSLIRSVRKLGLTYYGNPARKIKMS